MNYNIQSIIAQGPTAVHALPVHKNSHQIILFLQNHSFFNLFSTFVQINSTNELAITFKSIIMKTKNQETERPRNQKHEIFISQMIKHGDKIRAYKTAYGEDVKDESARVRASNLLKDPYIDERLQDSWKCIVIAIEGDKAAFIYNELKRLTLHRNALGNIIDGHDNAKPMDIIKAIRLDGELAEQEARLRGYGSIKPAKAVHKPVEDATPITREDEHNDTKTGNSVTNRNNPAIIIPVKQAPAGSHIPAAVCSAGSGFVKKNIETVIKINDPAGSPAAKDRPLPPVVVPAPRPGLNIYG